MIDARDELATARHLTVALYLACQAPTLTGGERTALATLANAVRERLESVEAALDKLIVADSGR